MIDRWKCLLMCVVCIQAQLPETDTLTLPSFTGSTATPGSMCRERMGARESTKPGHGTGLSLIRRQKWGNWMKKKDCGGIHDSDSKAKMKM